MSDLGVRIAFAAALAVLAAIFAVSSRTQPVAADGRLSRRVELVELISAEQERVAALRQRVEELSVELAQFQQHDHDDAAGLLQSQIDAIAAQAGMTPVSGPGVVVTLTDSPLQVSPSGDLNDLVVHEEDLQAVINALWAGGAEAVSVQGQRILATTAIRCVGNTLLLHGAVHSPPYRIEALGLEETLRESLAGDPAVERLRGRVRDFQLGLAVADAELLIPAFEGSTGIQVGRPTTLGGQ